MSAEVTLKAALKKQNKSTSDVISLATEKEKPHKLETKPPAKDFCVPCGTRSHQQFMTLKKEPREGFR